MAVLCRGAAEWTNLLGRIIAAVRDEDVREGRSIHQVGDDPDATRAVRLACVVHNHNTLVCLQREASNISPKS